MRPSAEDAALDAAARLRRVYLRTLRDAEVAGASLPFLVNFLRAGPFGRTLTDFRGRGDPLSLAAAFSPAERLQLLQAVNTLRATAEILRKEIQAEENALNVHSSALVEHIVKRATDDADVQSKSRSPEQIESATLQLAAFLQELKETP